MSDILNRIRDLEKINHLAENITKLPQKVNVPSLKGMIVLDPSKDPDPYSLHGIPLSIRLQEMGWT